MCVSRFAVAGTADLVDPGAEGGSQEGGRPRSRSQGADAAQEAPGLFQCRRRCQACEARRYQGKRKRRGKKFIYFILLFFLIGGVFCFCLLTLLMIRHPPPPYCSVAVGSRQRPRSLFAPQTARGALRPAPLHSLKTHCFQSNYIYMEAFFNHIVKKGA